MRTDNVLSLAGELKRLAGPGVVRPASHPNKPG